MKLLIVTQKVDETDPILGFFVSWIEEFAKHCEEVTVIAQSTGSYSLPENVIVYSLHKDAGASAFSQVLRFWKLITQERFEYGRVFVHMTPIWILLGAPLWIVLRKRMYLWYEIKRGSWKLSAALRVVRNVFAATEHGLPSVSRKQVIVGHGIDCDIFSPNHALREKNHLVAVGRLTKVKQYDVLLRALAKLPGCKLTIAGGTITEEDKQTEAELQRLITELSLGSRVAISWVPPKDMPALLQRADCMIHASQGGLDKAVLQAMACECPVVSTSEAAHSVLPIECSAGSESLAEKTQAILTLPETQRQSLYKILRSAVVADHSLSQCISRIVAHM